jgi:hypothetical protein
MEIALMDYQIVYGANWLCCRARGYHTARIFWSRINRAEWYAISPTTRFFPKETFRKV